jgi:hypothetical protein
VRILVVKDGERLGRMLPSAQVKRHGARSRPAFFVLLYAVWAPSSLGGASILAPRDAAATRLGCVGWLAAPSQRLAAGGIPSLPLCLLFSDGKTGICQLRQMPVRRGYARTAWVQPP